MPRFLYAVSAVTVIGLSVTTSGLAQDALLVPPAPASAVLAPPVPVGPYFAYDGPVYVAPVYVVPVYIQPVFPAPVVVVTDWYAPAYVAPSRVTVRSSPWSYKAEFEYATPFGSREVEYRVDRYGRVRIDYDD